LTSPEPLFASVALSLVSNLVYPALSALVARRAEAQEVGEALGALNGVKALTEGVGPLGFGLVMVEFERTALPGLPYLACAALSLLAWALSHRLPDLPKDEDEGDEELVGLLAADDHAQAEDAAAMEKRRLRALVAGYAPPLTLSPAAFAAGSSSGAPEREVPPMS